MVSKGKIKKVVGIVEAAYITYHTPYLSLKTRKRVIEEIGAQGIENLMEHVKWTDYLAFAVQDFSGRVVEIYKTGKTYMFRDNDDPKHNWKFPEEMYICDFIEKVLRGIGDEM